MKKRGALTLGFALLTVSFAGILSAKFDFQPGFSKYKTYNFHEAKIENTEPDSWNNVLRGLIQDAIAREMNIRQYKKSDQPDIWVSFYLHGQRKQIEVASDSYSGRPYYYDEPYYFGYDTSSLGTKVIRKRVGKLIIDLIDVQSNELVWQGFSAGTFPDEIPEPGKIVNRTIEKIFEQYPYEAGS